MQRAWSPRLAGGQEPGFWWATAQPELFVTKEHQAFIYIDVAELLRVVFNFHRAKLPRMDFRMHSLPGVDAYVEVARL